MKKNLTRMLTVLLLASAPSLAKADTFYTYEVSGDLVNNAQRVFLDNLSGTFTVNETTREWVAVDFDYAALGHHFSTAPVETVILSYFQSAVPVPLTIQLDFVADDGKGFIPQMGSVVSFDPVTLSYVGTDRLFLGQSIGFGEFDGEPRVRSGAFQLIATADHPPAHMPSPVAGGGLSAAVIACFSLIVLARRRRYQG